MYVSVVGPATCRRAALAVIRDEFSRIHATVPRLGPKEMVPMPRDPEVAVSYEHLLKLEQMRQTEYIPEGLDRAINVRGLLDRVESLEERIKRMLSWESAQGKRMELHLHDQSQVVMEVDKMTNNKQIIKGGSFSQCAVANQQTLDNCLNTIQQVENAELKAAMEKLHGEVSSLLMKFDDRQDVKRAAETRENLETLVKEASRVEPRRKWYELSAEGLIEASKFVKDFTGNIAGTVGQIGRLFWPDFKLPEAEKE
jgi:hypothetical protein